MDLLVDNTKPSGIFVIRFSYLMENIMAKVRIPKRMQSIPKPPEPCIACSGSGYYDHNGSPPCAACNGTGLDDPEGD